MNKNNELFKELAAVKFAVWELHLYLDTHPCDMQALALHNKYKQKLKELTDIFEENCYKLTANSAQGVEWFKSPWPWEKEGCGC